MSQFIALFLPLTILLFMGNTAEAAPFVCFTDNTSLSSSADPKMEEMAMSCTTRKNLGTAAKVVGISLQAGSFGLACTGIGAPASLYLQGGALGVQLIEIIVGELPCEDDESDEQIQERVNETVCTSLARQGLRCDLPRKNKSDRTHDGSRRI